jgi:hypothetical protein
MITSNDDDITKHNGNCSSTNIGINDNESNFSEGTGDDYFNIYTSNYNINNVDDYNVNNVDDIDEGDNNSVVDNNEDDNNGIVDNNEDDNVFKESIIGTLKNTNNIISILYNKIVSLIKKNILLNNNFEQLNNKFIRLNNKFKKIQEINKLTELDEFIIKDDNKIKNGDVKNGDVKNGDVKNGDVKNGDEPKINKRLLNNNIDKLLIELINNNSDINLSEMLIDTNFKAIDAINNGHGNNKVINANLKVTDAINNGHDKIINTNFKAADAINNGHDNNEKELYIKNKLRNIIIETQKVAEIKNTINKRKKNILFNI